jgi:hypothetical protein
MADRVLALLARRVHSVDLVPVDRVVREHLVGRDLVADLVADPVVQEVPVVLAVLAVDLADPVEDRGPVVADALPVVAGVDDVVVRMISSRE